MRRRGLMAAVLAAAALVAPVGALAFGPQQQEPARSACNAAFERQLEAGITAGGGPKAGEPGPLNCDHFFQRIGSIGNDWPPPPFQD